MRQTVQQQSEPMPVSHDGSGAPPADKPSRRLRPRPAGQSYVDRHPQLDAVLGAAEEEEGGSGTAGRRLDVPLMCSRVERTAAATPLPASHPSQATAEALVASGLRQPLLVPANACGRGAAGAAATRAALGLHLPSAVATLTPRGLAAAIGPDHQVCVRAWCMVGFCVCMYWVGGHAAQTRQPSACSLTVAVQLWCVLPPSTAVAAAVPSPLQVPTIDVATQDSGPRLTVRQLADYLEQQQAMGSRGHKQQQHQGQQHGRLLNVVSLSLAGTPLEVSRLPCWRSCRLLVCWSCHCSLTWHPCAFFVACLSIRQAAPAPSCCQLAGHHKSTLSVYCAG